MLLFAKLYVLKIKVLCEAKYSASAPKFIIEKVSTEVTSTLYNVIRISKLLQLDGDTV